MKLRQDDIMPLADNSHNYWSGYFTSRPALKRQVRFATSYLESARLLEVVTNTSKKDVNRPTYKKEPVVGDSWTGRAEGTVGVATHHDGMSGTERQDVTDDYAQRITESALEAEAGVAVAFGRLLGVGREAFEHCNCNSGPMSCLNLCGNQNLTARPPRHRRDACSWRCRFLTAQRGQHGRIIAMHPTHWLISTQV